MGRHIDAVQPFAGPGPAFRARPPVSSGRREVSVREERAEAFAAAGRRSARIRFLRKALLVGVVGAVAAMAGIWIFHPFSKRAGDLSFASLGVEGSKVAIARPKLSGFKNDGQAYFLTAERALQDVRQPTRIELQKLTGEIGATGGETTHIRANAGVYDSAAEIMRLADDVRISNARFEVRLRSADIDFKTGRYRSDQPVEVRLDSGATIVSDRAEARNNGQELEFTGRVRTTVVPQTGQGADGSKGDHP